MTDHNETSVATEASRRVINPAHSHTMSSATLMALHLHHELAYLHESKFLTAMSAQSNQLNLFLRHVVSNYTVVCC